jgi:hypothetical protein
VFVVQSREVDTSCGARVARALCHVKLTCCRNATEVKYELGLHHDLVTPWTGRALCDIDRTEMSMDWVERN